MFHDLYIVDYIAAVLSGIGMIALLSENYKVYGWGIWVIASILWVVVGYQNNLFGMAIINFITMILEMYGTFKEVKKLRSRKAPKKPKKRKLKLEDVFKLNRG